MNFKKLDSFIDEIPKKYDVPGCDIKIYIDNKEVYRKFSGYSDIEKRTHINGKELYFLFSNTKVSTVTAGMTLLERGKFLLTDPVYEYIPEFKDITVKKIIDGKEEIVPAEKAMTVRDLFTMSSGLSYNLSRPEFDEVIKKTDGKAPTLEIVKSLAKCPLDFEPHTDYQYSLSHDVLGAVIEVVSGMRFGEYLKENVFKPLAMNVTTFRATEKNINKIAPLYHFDNEKNKPIKGEKKNPYCFGTEYESGGAGLISCTNDYARLFTALANGGVGENGNRILSSAAVNLMRRNQLDEKRIAKFQPGLNRFGYGYGLGVRTLIDPAEAGGLSGGGEFGWDGAAGSFNLIDPEKKLGVFYVQHMLGNGKYNPFTFIHPRLRNIIYGCVDD